MRRFRYVSIYLDRSSIYPELNRRSKRAFDSLRLLYISKSMVLMLVTYAVELCM